MQTSTSAFQLVNSFIFIQIEIDSNGARFFPSQLIFRSERELGEIFIRFIERDNYDVEVIRISVDGFFHF